MSAKRPRLSCAVLVKQVDRHLPGWLAWHLSLGVEHIAVIDESPDGEARQIIQALQPEHPLSHVPVTLPDSLTAEARRLEMTRHALEHLREVAQGFEETTAPTESHAGALLPEDWIIILDADEYLGPEHALESLFRKADEDSAAIALNWRIHGTAGHLYPPPGHVISNHPWHGVPDFPDHRFVRLLARLEYLPEPAQLTDPLTLDLPPEWIIQTNGQPYQPDNAATERPWAEGCIQHYICAQAHGEKDLPPAMRNYYDRNEQLTAPPLHRLQALRRVANQLREQALLCGLSRLQEIANDHVERELSQQVEHDEHALAEHIQHNTFHYDRVWPPARAALLSNRQYSPRYRTGQTVTLRLPEGQVLSCNMAEQERPFIGYWQESIPHILTLTTQDGREAALGDAPCPFGTTSLRISFVPEKRAFYLPHETGQGNIPLEMHPVPAPLPLLFLPLPTPDETRGLSVEGLLTWVAGHPAMQPQDLQRALLLLTPDSARNIRKLAPMLEEFLFLPIPRPDFLPR